MESFPGPHARVEPRKDHNDVDFLIRPVRPVHRMSALRSRRDLTGRVALITGAAQGIGEGIARRFIDAGAQVVIADRAVDKGEALAADLGDSARFVALDVTDIDAWHTAIAQTERLFGPLNVLVNNAGVAALTYLESYAPEDYDRVMKVDHEGVVFGMRAAIPSLRRGGHGSIVNISSLQGIEADVGLLAYVAAKFAVRGVTKGAAVELGKDGIRVNSIHPGFIRSDMTGGVPDGRMGRIPLRRPSGDRTGLPADVGGLALYLASDASSYVTGAEIVIDGGKSIRFPSVAEDHTDFIAEMGARR
ncbi:MAG: glucose 1-dehydrogenase [Actinomycetota bacterium]|nr:glucose 1-dehydrogenase [Actinomycetota bacterium]